MASNETMQPAQDTGYPNKSGQERLAYHRSDSGFSSMEYQRSDNGSGYQEHDQRSNNRGRGYSQRSDPQYNRSRDYYQEYNQSNSRSYGGGGYQEHDQRSNNRGRGYSQGYDWQYNRSRGYSQGYDPQYSRSKGYSQEYNQSNSRSYGGDGYQDDTTISRKLSNILRHTAEKLHLKMDSNGFIFVADLLKLESFHNVTDVAIKRIVEQNDKQRFSLKTDEVTQKLKIRANQGHSVKFENLDLGLTPITDAEEYPDVLHGTYYQYWDSIRREGLKRMKRVHIHFAAGLPGEDQVISGMRSSCDLLIYMDMKKAIEDGLKFSVSANKVILCSGDEKGVIAPKYFSKVIDRKLGKPVSMDESSPRKLPVGMVVDDSDKSKSSRNKSKFTSSSQSIQKLPVGMTEEDLQKPQTGKNQSKKMKKDSNAKKNASENKQNPKENFKQEKKDGEDDLAMDEDDKDSGNKKKQPKKDKKELDAEKNSPENKQNLKEAKDDGAMDEDDKESENKINKSKKSKKESGAEKNSPENKQNSKDKNFKQEKKDGEEDLAMDEDDKDSGNKKKQPKKNKKESDAEKNSPDLHDETGTQKSEMKNAKVKDNDKPKESLAPPEVIFIESAEDEQLNQLKQREVLGVHVVEKEEKILYILISLPGTVFIFDPKNTNEFLKTLLENDKCEKVMFDSSIIHKIYQQWKIVLYKKSIVDISVLYQKSCKKTYLFLSEMIGEVLGKISLPEMAEPLKKIDKELPVRKVKKTVAQFSHLIAIFEKVKSDLDEDVKTEIFEKYSASFDEDTKMELEKEK